MKYLLFISALFLPATALAQSVVNHVTIPPVVEYDGSGTALADATNHALRIECISNTCGGGGGAVTQSGAWAQSIINGSNTLSINSSGQASVTDSAAEASLASALTTLSSQLTALTTISGAINAPLNAQITHGILVGAVEGATAAGTSRAFPLTIQGNASGVAVPVSGATTVAGNSSGAISIVQADSSVPINVATATTTQLVALAAGKSIYITGWDVLVAAADSVTLEYGTGTNCGTGTTALTGAYNFAANGGLVAGGNLGIVFKVPAGNALCLVTSAAAQASGRVTYAQF